MEFFIYHYIIKEDLIIQEDLILPHNSDHRLRHKKIVCKINGKLWETQ